ncbi:MAG: peptidoglycan DD-metalloendopeptidase family protein [Alphaproteobacteria bacterium]|nr:peptidoglycan DD-metalloendopeptidase family protein [Alphaproteobacteria bacterium]
MMDRQKNISCNSMAREVSLFVGFVLFSVMFLAQSALAGYAESMANLHKCALLTYAEIWEEMRDMDDLIQQDTKIFWSTGEDGTFAGSMKQIYKKLQKVRDNIQKGKSECTLEDIRIIMDEVKNKAEKGTKKWLAYAERIKDDDAITNRKKELTQINSRYKAILAETEKLNEQGINALDDLQKCAPEAAKKIKDKITDLSSLSYRNRSDANDGSKVSKIQEDIVDKLKDIKKAGSCNENVLNGVSEVVASMAMKILRNYQNEALDSDDDAAAQDIQEKIAEVKARAALRSCPLVADVKAKHHSGCWPCLVLEKITSAFLHAAKVGLPVTQRAGVTVLILGIAIWLVVWGLKNVSSFTEIQIGNILNELLKFLFKAALAYWLIYHSLPFIKNYLIYPIMSAGSLIGQQFWDDDIKKFTESWVDLTDEDYAEMAKDFQEQDKQQGETPVPSASAAGQATTPVPTELTPEQKKLLANQPTRLKMVGNIPDFVLPGCSGCRLTSPSGPRSNCSGVCSSCHGGADFGARSVGVQGDPIWAIAPGKVHTISNQSKAGHYIVLEHDAKGQKWYSVYMHLMNGSDKVQRGQKVVARQQIANMGNTGSSTGAHLHLEIWDAAPFTQWQHQLNPLWLAHKEKVPAKKWCYEEMGDKDPYAGQCQNKCVFEARSISGKTSDELPDLSSTYIGTTGLREGGFSTDDYSSLIVEIPEIRYTGPTDIMPKSVMNSILGAIRAITDKTADVMVLGDVIMCYAGMPNGGAIKVDGIKGEILESFMGDSYVIHPFIWLSGCIILGFGFFLTFAIAYYLIDISFKIGFAVLALPLVIGLWPFEIKKKKFIDTISIITKASATFAFFVLTTSFGMAMLENSFANGLSKIYDMIDILAGLPEETQTADIDRMKAYLSDETTLFSMTFLTILFSLIYFIKLIQATTSDLVNKFFPDGVFGDQSPMHKGATMATSFAKNIAMKPVGMARDIAAHQAGRALKATGKGVAQAVRHPIRSVREVANKFRGKK